MAKILPAAKCEAFTPSFHTKVFLEVYLYCKIHIASVFNQTLTCKCLLFARLSTRVRYGYLKFSVWVIKEPVQQLT